MDHISNVLLDQVKKNQKEIATLKSCFKSLQTLPPIVRNAIDFRIRYLENDNKQMNG